MPGEPRLDRAGAMGTKRGAPASLIASLREPCGASSSLSTWPESDEHDEAEHADWVPSVASEEIGVPSSRP